MATKTLTVVRPGRYGTRMLSAGDTFDATAPEARLYSKLGWATEGGFKPVTLPEKVNVGPVPKPKATRKPATKRKAPARKKAAAKK